MVLSWMSGLDCLKNSCWWYWQKHHACDKSSGCIWIMLSGTWCDSWGGLCRARSWTLVILESPFQIPIFCGSVIIGKSRFSYKFVKAQLNRAQFPVLLTTWMKKENQIIINLKRFVQRLGIQKDKSAKGKGDPPVESQGSEWTRLPNLASHFISGFMSKGFSST